MDSSVALASLTSLLADIKLGVAFIWSVFGDMVDTIASNPLLLYSVGFAIVCGTLGIGFAVVKKFGLRGRRR